MTTLSDRFWSKVQKSDGCWIWKAKKHRQGYGEFSINGKPRLAHRVSWELTHGTIPGGIKVCHGCDNPPCVNPAHLFLGTQQDNVSDCVAKGRFPSRKGACNGRAKLSQADREQIINLSHALSQQKLADMFGVGQTTVGRLLNGLSWAT